MFVRLFLRLFLFVMLCIPGLALADANSGEFMGYRLGDAYNAGPATEKRVTTTGNLVITAEQPVKPDNIEQVSLLTTRKSMTVGSISASQWFATEAEARMTGKRYFELLRSKYPDWDYGWEVMNAHMKVTQLSLRNPPYELRMKLSQDNQNSDRPWHFSMSLFWIDLSKSDRAWRETSSRELIRLQQKEQKKLLDEADSRGL